MLTLKTITITKNYHEQQQPQSDTTIHHHIKINNNHQNNHEQQQQVDKNIRLITHQTTHVDFLEKQQ